MLLHIKHKIHINLISIEAKNYIIVFYCLLVHKKQLISISNFFLLLP